MNLDPRRHVQAPGGQPLGAGIVLARGISKPTPWWLWGMVIVTCSSAVLLVAGVLYIGTVSPETSVYVGNRVPKRFLDEARALGALAPGETVRYFYSDGFPDIKDGFYVVSDRGVVVYSQKFGDTPLTKLPFGSIAEAELQRDTSFFVDSEITLTLHDGTFVSFPVSSERNGDVRFHAEIVRQLGSIGASPLLLPRGPGTPP